MTHQNQDPIAVTSFLRATKPTLILPCSAQKLDTREQAFNMYQGKGYVGIVRQWPREVIEGAFNVLFLSAKYGLIPASERIEPYEQVLTPQRVKEFASAKSLRNKAQGWLRVMN